LSPGAFSRSFRRHTGQALTRYVIRLRINLACQEQVTDIPYIKTCWGFSYLAVVIDLYSHGVAGAGQIAQL